MSNWPLWFESMGVFTLVGITLVVGIFAYAIRKRNRETDAADLKARKS